MDDRERLVAALLNRQLTPDDMFSYIKRTPGLLEQYTPEANFEQLRESYLRPDADQIRFGQSLGEAVAVGDPFGVTQLQRLFGFNVPQQVRLNEAHGLANRERERYYPYPRVSK